MFNRRFTILFLCLLTLFPLQTFANPVDEWTLATVPSLDYVSANENTHTIRIVTTNSGTEMYLERSNNGSAYQLLKNWTPYNNGDTFSLTLDEDEVVFLRIKARNTKGIETDFSQPLRIESSKPAKPVTRGQESGDDYVSIDFEPLSGNSVYWIHRLDKSSPEKVTTIPYRDNTVLPAREYTYEFWVDSSGVISDKNRIIIWTKPQKPVVQVGNVSNDRIELKVDTLNNPDNITIEAQDEEGRALNVEGKYVKASGLKAQTEYVFRVRLKSGNGEYTAWVEVTAKTTNNPTSGSASSNPTPDQSELERQFQEEAKKIINELIYKANGEPNSESAWIDLSLGSTTSYRVEASINGETKVLSTQPVRFDELRDNYNYTAEIRVSDGMFTYTETISIATPNRTSPMVLRGFYNEGTKELVIEVESKNGIKN